MIRLFVQGVFVVCFMVIAGIAEACTISVTPVAFGAYDVFADGALDSTGSVVYQCGAGVASISITISRGSSTTYRPRTLLKGTEPLDYNLFLDAAGTRIWGDTTESTEQYTATNPPADTQVTVTVYGRIPARQNVTAGAYSDGVVVVVNF